ncbi:uncharacterized protein LOC125507816 [Triticum urartu]|nr:uncharacterized protein LOC125507816 [Triticum urartu]XP_048528281.1 uncharacterized protein LOC125507816 [Triticum urartu]XP_048528282.1 uncharacterized protein LOC125507816 [Triticum urartu]
MTGPLNGEVLCATGDIGHVHGECHSGPFKVVLVSMIGEDFRPIACVYSSETGLWGSLVSSPCSPPFGYGRTGRLVGNTLYWLLWSVMRDSILEFDLENLSLVLMDQPPIDDDFRLAGCQIIKAEDDALGFAYLSYPSFQMWQRNFNAHGVAIWVLWKTIELHSILGLPPQIQRPASEVVTVTDSDHAGKMGVILSYAEDTDVVFIFVDANVYNSSVSLTTILSQVSMRQAHPLLVDLMELKMLHNTLDDC